jgi:hypothetical protein
LSEHYLGDLQIVARFLSAIEANILYSFLRSCAIDAVAGDTHLVQTDSLLTIALGGACVRVPRAQVSAALELIAARDRGELALSEDDQDDEDQQGDGECLK